MIIGGFFNELFPFLEEPIKSAANDVSLSAPWEACAIRPSKLGMDAHLIGAAELVFAEVIANPSGSGNPVGTGGAVHEGPSVVATPAPV